MRCPYPLDAPEGYEWGGVNLVNQYMQLECKSPTNPIHGESYTKFRCLQTLEWDNDINSTDVPQCGGWCRKILDHSLRFYLTM